MNTIEQKRSTYDKWFKICLVALAALIISPIIFMVVKGMVGLIIAGAVGLVAVNIAPIVSMKLANWKVKGIVAEAKENPIETMYNLLAAKKQAFQVFKSNVQDAQVGLKTFEQKCTEFAKQYPARAQEFIVQVDNMNKLVTRKREALLQAQDAIKHGELKLSEMSAYWEMSQIAQAANKSANMDTGDAYEKLKLDTSCDAVFDSVNRAFSEMEIAADLVVGQIENNPSPTLNNIVEVKSKVLV